MAGQGSPHPERRRPRSGARPGDLGARARSWLPLCACWFVAFFALLGATAAHGEDLDLRVRLTWGGGVARKWQLTLKLDEGKIAEPQSLATEPDAPGATWLAADGVLHVQPREPRSFDGCDVTLRGSSTAKVQVELHAPPIGAEASEPKSFEIPLADLVAGTVNRPLDERGGQLVLRRAPGDKLRVTLERDSLVFTTGEVCTLTAQPHLTGLAPGTSVRFQARVVPARGSQELWTESHELRVAADGNLQSVGPIRVPVPATEGAYDIILSLTKWQLRAPFVPVTPDVERRVQLVAVDRQVSLAPAAPWQTILEFDPANNAWWKPLAQLNPLARKAALGNQKSQPWAHGSTTWLQIARDGWQAYPLVVQQVDRPHVLEIEYPSDVPQSVGLTIVEPNAAGRVTALAANSGWDVSPSPLALDPAEPRRVHRFVFWPRTTSPLVLVANRREDAPAAIGTIRVLAGPTDLAPPALPAVGPGVNLAPTADGRLAAAYFQRPLMPECFSAGEAIDEASKRTYDDWVTFLDAGRRYVQYLKFAGYNAAVIPVYHEGATLYPSRLLEPTPRYDSGVFFPSGQDPVRKDVLELWLRLFDREGLRLIPAMQFASPLPELEILRRTAGDPRTSGLAWIGPEGLELLERQASARGLAPLYNILDPRVQQAMRRAAGELAARCKGHASFGGLALQLGPETFAQLPGLEWGLDDQTIERFEKAANLKLPADEGAERFPNRAAALLKDREKRAEWIDWRVTTLAAFHRELHRELLAVQPMARLILETSEVPRTPALEAALKPTLPRRMGLVAAAREIGLDPSQYAETPGIVLLRPTRHAPNQPLAARAAQLELAGSAEADRAFGLAATRGAVWLHEPQMLSLPGFADVSPFGKENTSFWQFPSLAPSDAANRKRLIHTLAALDATVCLDGGWLLPMGQEDALREVLDVYCRLPDARFETVSPSGMAAVRGGMQPVTLRMLKQGGRAWIYLVNDSPWEVKVELDLALPPGARWETLGRRSVPAVQPRMDGAVWKLTLAPYDLVALTCTNAEGHVRGAVVEIGPQVEQHLAKHIAGLGNRKNTLAEIEPRVKLANPSFEAGAMAGTLPNWITKQAAAGKSVAAVEAVDPKGGAASMRLENGGMGAAWVRSSPFPNPLTGRLALSCWVRTDAAGLQQQTSLRLAFEGRQNGLVWYKFATIGGARTPLASQWTQYLFQVDALPANVGDLRVGFDLMTAGKVWIDDVQVLDLPFDENERNELAKIIAVADFQLGGGQLSDCRQTLESYWPMFLATQVPAGPPQLARGPGPAAALPKPPGPAAPANAPPMPPIPPPAAPAPSFLERLRGSIPSWR